MKIVKPKGFNPKETFSWVLAENKFNGSTVFSVLNGGLHLQPEASSENHAVLSRGLVVREGEQMHLKFNSLEHHDPDLMLFDHGEALTNAFSRVLREPVKMPRKWRQRLEERR